MTIDGKIKDEKLQYNISREAAKIRAIPSVKINKQEYLTEKEILPSYQIQIIEPAKFIHSSYAKHLKSKHNI